LLISPAAAAVVAPVQAVAHLARYLRSAELIEPQGLKVGPLPRLRPPGYPWRRYFVFSDGQISGAGGSCWSLSMQQVLDAGFAREIPYGLDIQSEPRKLWRLGRRTFAPKQTKDIMSAQRDDAKAASGPSAGKDHDLRSMITRRF
jgi:hypothetical protein